MKFEEQVRKSIQKRIYKLNKIRLNYSDNNWSSAHNTIRELIELREELGL